MPSSVLLAEVDMAGGHAPLTGPHDQSHTFGCQFGLCWLVRRHIRTELGGDWLQPPVKGGRQLRRLNRDRVSLPSVGGDKQISVKTLERHEDSLVSCMRTHNR